jgi:hypothetical protein
MRGVNPFRQLFDAIPTYGATHNRAAMVRHQRALLAAMASSRRRRAIAKRSTV